MKPFMINDMQEIKVTDRDREGKTNPLVGFVVRLPLASLEIETDKKHSRSLKNQSVRIVDKEQDLDFHGEFGGEIKNYLS